MGRGPAGSTLIWADSFENGFVTPNIWSRLQCQDATASGSSLVADWPNGTPRCVTLPAGSGFDGGKSVRFELRSGDVGAGSGERAEMSGDGMSWRFREGDERVIQFRVKFATNWTPGTAGDRFNIFCQFHSGSGSPPMSMHIGDDGRMYLDDGGPARDAHIAATGSQIRRTIMPGTEWKAKRGTWIDINLRVKFSNSMSIGGAEVHIDGVKRLAWHNRQTMASNITYMKMGQYRFPQAQTNILWMDDMRLTSGTIVGDSEAPPVEEPAPGGTGNLIVGETTKVEASSATSVVCNVPSDVAQGGILVAEILSSITDVVPTLPTGWSPIATVDSPTLNGVSGRVCYRRISNEPASYTFDSGSATLNRMSASITRFGGVGSVVLDAGAQTIASTAATNNVTLPSITTVTPGALIVYYHMMNASAGSLSVPPSGLTKFVETLTGNGRYFAGFYEGRSAAGATGTRLFGQTSATTRSMAAISFALRPGTTVTASAPTVEVGANGQVIAGSQFARTATENNGGDAITSRSWVIASGPTGTGTNLGTTAALTWTPTVAGTYVLRYSATNSVGTATDQLTVLVTAVGAVSPRAMVQAVGGTVPADGNLGTNLVTPLLAVGATAGNFLVAAWSVDLDSGPFLPPAGWTVLANRPAASVSLLVCGKIAVGGERQVRADWTTPQDQSNCLIAEYSGVDPANPYGVDNFPGYVDVQFTDITLDPSPAVVEGMALAFIAPANTRTAPTKFDPSAPGWNRIFNLTTDADLSAGLAMFHRLNITAGENLAETFSYVATTRRQGFILVLNAAGANAPPPTDPDPEPNSLSWLPPTGFQNFSLRSPTSATSLNTIDGGGGDVRIVLPSTPIAPIVIQNCRHAVLIGGQINMLGVETLGTDDQRGVYVRNCTGTIHIEGLFINGHASGFGDGFAANSPSALLQIQNCLVKSMRGSTANHGDVFQPWGGLREFRIDRLTGSSDYQGLHIGEDLGAIGSGIIRNTNLFGQAVSSAGGGHLIWTNPDAYPLTLENVWIQPRAGRSFNSSIWPQPGDASFPATVTNGFATWPSSGSLITGGVREGRPTVDFVQQTDVGIGYVSPYTPPETPPPATGTSPTLRDRCVGFPEVGQGRVTVNTNAVRARLRCGTDAAVSTDIVYGPYVTPNAQGDADLIVGLPATFEAGEYFYRVAMVNAEGGEWLDTNANVGRLLTAPTGRVGLTISGGSCINATDSASATAMANRRDNLGFCNGDLWYADGSGTTVANYRSKMDAKKRAPNLGRWFATTPMIYTPSDHDYGMVDDGIGAGAGGTSWNQVFREKWPHPALPVTGSLGCYWTRPWGTGIRIIVLDTRSFAVVGSTKLGSTQKTWFKNVITTMEEDVALIIQDGVYIGSTDAGSDDWQGSLGERNEIGDFIAASGKKVVWFGGDSHAVGGDNGTNSRGGFPVYQCAPLNNTSSQKGGPYSAGLYPTTTGTSVQQYGRLVVTFGTTTVTCAFTGYSSDNTVRKTITTTFPAAPAPVPTGRVRRLWNGTALVRRKLERWTGSTTLPIERQD